MPYIAHLLAVASLVLEAEGDEEMAVAAVLHDATEDANIPLARIQQEFGSRVARIVDECSDTLPGAPRDETNWQERKQSYLEKLADADQDALVVSCVDKLHNARSLRIDLEREGERLWDRFNEKDPAKQRCYYESLVEVFGRRLDEPKWLPEELRRTVSEIFKS